jgi:ribosome-associated translation inhibitor RaiA
MNIQINTDHHIQGTSALIAKFNSTIESALSRMSDHITSVQVHLSDENGDKRGENDKRCMLEARLQGRQPIIVINHAATLEQALDGAADKLINLSESTLGRQRDRRSHKPQHSTPDLKIPEEN